MRLKNLYFLFLSVYNNKKLVTKLGVHFGDGCRFIAVKRQTFGSEPYLIKLGNFVSISEGVRFITHDGGVWVHRNLDKSNEKIDHFGRIVIGNNVFIGMNVTILPNINIGDNCVIGTGSIVTKDIPSNSVVAGVPAKVLSSVDKYYSKNKNNFVNLKGLNHREKEKILRETYKLGDL
tara:strand:- start:5772 stop:6302 length:531 start_codon:yes stop_codon:yes gene_type:complete